MAASQLLDVMRPVVDATIASLENKKFRSDPIGGAVYARATSIVSSAYKRHGQILERAVRERLGECGYFTVRHEPAFRIPASVDNDISDRNSDIEDSLPADMPYGKGARTIQVDAVVFDSRINSLRCYEIKRGNGAFDSGKKRSILRDVLAAQTLLRSYGRSKGFEAGIVESRLISYYGIRALPEALNLIGDDLDDHFVFRVREPVEEVNAYFKERLYGLLDRATGLTEIEGLALCDRFPLHNRSPVVS